MKRIKSRKVRKRRIKIIVIFLMIICLGTLIASAFEIYKWKIDSNKTNEQVNKVQEITKIEEVTNEDDVLVIPQEEEISKANPYWDYIKMNLIHVDFQELTRVNQDTKGWIQVNGTNVNYPFVQVKNNDYYLNHSFDKSWNSAGWVYLDYRNNVNNLDKNTIIYAHGRYDNTMFGSLRKILSNGWLKDKNNFVIKLSTEKENTLWQVFSVYRIPTTSDYLQVEFYDNQEFLDFTDMLIKRSGYDFKTSVYENDMILTLSTCYDDYDKLVVHAKMIKKESR